MHTIPYLRTQTELLADIEALVRDTSNARWSEAEIYLAINMALLTWADKVKLPYLYTISGGYTAETYEYDLPAYIRPPIYPEVYRLEPYYEEWPITAGRHWQELPGWELVPNDSGTLTLRVYHPRTLEGQLWFYAPNSRVPLTPPTTSGSTSSTATTMTLDSAVDVDDVGIVKCEAEYMAVAVTGRAAATTTLTILQHGLYGSTAATHNSGSTVTWCVGADTLSLYQLLYNQARSILAQMPLFGGSTKERAEYEKLMGYYQQLADEYWQRYAPARPSTSIRLNRKVFALR